MNPVEFRVKSQSEKKLRYRVQWTGASNGSTCTCKDYKWSQVCKHIRAVRRWRRAQKNYARGTPQYANILGEVLERTFESDGEEDMANSIEAADRITKMQRYGSD